MAGYNQKPPKLPTITKDIEIDTAIIGGGITGLSAAYHLTKSKHNVAVFDAYQVGTGTTGHSTGNLYVAVQPYFQNIASAFNLETATRIAQSRKLAIDFIEKLVKEFQIDCHFSCCPWYIYTNDKERLDFLQKEVETYAKMHLPIEEVKNLPIDLKIKKAYVMPDQARINPMQYVVLLANHLKEQGCDLYEDTRIVEIIERKIIVYSRLKILKSKPNMSSLPHIHPLVLILCKCTQPPIAVMWWRSV